LGGLKKWVWIIKFVFTMKAIHLLV
jgi:hypothetical protein